FTHAMRAEEEYRALIQEYPDSKLLPQAKQRLREVQEVLAQREFNIGRFYYLRQSYPAAIARLQTLVDRYPLFSGADQALFLLGQSFEGEIELVRRNPRADEVTKSKMIADFTKKAAEAYSKIITRYPAMDRALDAKARLESLHQTVPRPTRAALELNKKELASRQEAGFMSGMLGNFQKHPDVAKAPHVGEPTLVDPTPITATEVVKQAAQAAGGDNKLKVETVNGAVPQSQQTPRSDTPAPDASAAPPPEQPAAPTSDQANTGVGEMKPNAPDPNELKPNVPADPNALPPPAQTNEIQPGSSSSSSSASSSTASSSKDDLVDISSSKKKKKKGLGKLNPF
ncbi:MAG TPA: outer membrane protein assembly factor BamD, partial [Bryobacteraceae bacterium]|nr:outer membrane protein assembly factor BamD [Bryobacteraceae bacterium]